MQIKNKKNINLIATLALMTLVGPLYVQSCPNFNVDPYLQGDQKGVDAGVYFKNLFSNSSYFKDLVKEKAESTLKEFSNSTLERELGFAFDRLNRMLKNFIGTYNRSPREGTWKEKHKNGNLKALDSCFEKDLVGQYDVLEAYKGFFNALSNNFGAFDRDFSEGEMSTLNNVYIKMPFRTDEGSKELFRNFFHDKDFHENVVLIRAPGAKALHLDGSTKGDCMLMDYTHADKDNHKQIVLDILGESICSGAINYGKHELYGTPTDVLLMAYFVQNNKDWYSLKNSSGAEKYYQNKPYGWAPYHLQKIYENQKHLLVGKYQSMTKEQFYNEVNNVYRALEVLTPFTLDKKLPPMSRSEIAKILSRVEGFQDLGVLNGETFPTRFLEHFGVSGYTTATENDLTKAGLPVDLLKKKQIQMHTVQDQKDAINQSMHMKMPSWYRQAKNDSSLEKQIKDKIPGIMDKLDQAGQEPSNALRIANDLYKEFVDKAIEKSPIDSITIGNTLKTILDCVAFRDHSNGSDSDNVIKLAQAFAYIEHLDGYLAAERNCRDPSPADFLEYIRAKQKAGEKFRTLPRDLKQKSRVDYSGTVDFLRNEEEECSKMYQNIVAGPKIKKLVEDASKEVISDMEAKQIPEDNTFKFALALMSKLAKAIDVRHSYGAAVYMEAKKQIIKHGATADLVLALQLMASSSDIDREFESLDEFMQHGSKSSVHDAIGIKYVEDAEFLKALTNCTVDCPEDNPKFEQKQEMAAEPEAEPGSTEQQLEPESEPVTQSDQQEEPDAEVEPTNQISAAVTENKRVEKRSQGSQNSESKDQKQKSAQQAPQLEDESSKKKAEEKKAVVNLVEGSVFKTINIEELKKLNSNIEVLNGLIFALNAILSPVKFIIQFVYGIFGKSDETIKTSIDPAADDLDATRSGAEAQINDQSALKSEQKQKQAKLKEENIPETEARLDPKNQPKANSEAPAKQQRTEVSQEQHPETRSEVVVTSIGENLEPEKSGPEQKVKGGFVRNRVQAIEQKSAKTK